MKQRRYPDRGKLGMLVIAGVGLALWLLERRRPLRAEVEDPRRRQPRNLSIAALAAVTVQLAEQPLVEPVARLVTRRQWGLLPALVRPGRLRTALALILLDYTLYLWHVLTHRVPVLWRFHAVHHVDLDLDASTAVRFHAGELMLSIPWRAAQIAAIGVSPRDLRLWQQLVLVSILFHHSNLRLPEPVERLVGLVFATPRLHGIHHANEPALRDSNWSSGLSIWDRLHGTYRDDVSQDALTIGVEGFDDPEDVSLPKVLALPWSENVERSS